jgi:hypothetical protein
VNKCSASGAEPKRSSSGCIAEAPPKVALPRGPAYPPLMGVTFGDWRAHFIGDGDGSPPKGTKCPMLENSPPYGESKSERRHRPKDLLRTG